MLRPPEAALLRRAVHEFNRGEYFECHETLEDLWNVLDGVPKRAVQGVLQTAVGFLHAERGNRLGAVKLLRDGIAKLEDPHAPASIGLTLDGWLESVRACLARVEVALTSGDGGNREGILSDLRVPGLPVPEGPAEESPS